MGFSKAKFHEATMTISISAQRISGAQIKDGRKLLGWTQQKLAEKADLSRNTVRRIELGEAGRGGSIEKAAHVLRSSGIELVPGDGVMRPSLRSPFSAIDSTRAARSEPRLQRRRLTRSPTRTDAMSAPKDQILEKAKELCRCEGKAWNLDDFGNGVLGVTMLTVVADDNDRTYYLHRAKAFLKQK
jgi:transcriptional regulator with XRE-family HTH domain